MLNLQYQQLGTTDATKHSCPRVGWKVETQVLFLPSHCTAISCKQDVEQTELFHPRPFGMLEGGDELWSLQESGGGTGGLAAPTVLLREGMRGKRRELMSDQAVAMFLLPAALHLIGRLGREG